MKKTIAIEIIGLLDKEFDSHDFIHMLLKKHPEEYGKYLIKYGSNGGVAAADGGVALYLSNHRSDLKIDKVGERISKNILGKDSKNALWSK